MEKKVIMTFVISPEGIRIEEGNNVQNEETAETPEGIYYYVNKLSERLGWSPKRTCGYLSKLWDVYPAAAFSVVLREIAIELDKKYEGHINDCKEIYVVSLLDGRISKVCRAHIKNFRNFAAFRTLEDAKLACHILRRDLKEMFKSDKQ